MEKLSKLIISNILDLGKIDFSGFSSSEMWCGYFEAKDNVVKCEDAYNLVQGYFKSLDQFFALTALCYGEFKNKNIFNKYSNGTDLSFFEKAKELGILKKLTDKFDGYLIGDNDLPIEHLTLTFDENIYFSLCNLVMHSDLILGEVCFFIHPKLNIAIYPHNDIGFGVIALDSDPTLGIEFLKFCEKDSRFKVNIEPEILSNISKI
ncbi:hypothetical protein [Avibacterium avium]|uniref:hypothetical protein n=1 Tax=Avibacterium avium TaxID=751 RepID=UPI003BF847DF